ncbi:MAG: hypothetical protein J6W03_10220 [Bacteroidaceae bacterium]|nr:hypothetical protein [Bacteroidaceae bacterium]
MKKILSIVILAVASFLSASASQVVKVVYNGTSRSITFRTNNVSATRIYYARSTSANPSFTSNVTPTNSGNYSTFIISSGTTNNDNNKTIQIQLDDAVTFFEITTNPTYAVSIDFSKAQNLASISLKGCTGLTAMTLGTMSTLTDIDVSNTSAAVANAITAAKCPALESLNVANCGLTSLAYTGTTLYYLDVTGNDISNLNLSGNTNLDIVRCESNNMFSLALPSSVTTISAQDNNLEDLTGYGEQIKVLDVASNGLTTLSMDGLSGLTDLDISSNHLTFRSFPSADNKPERMLYAGNDGLYDFSGSMKAPFDDYDYPLQSKLPNYAARNETAYTLDLTDARLDGNGVQSVVPVVNSYNGTTDTPLTLATSDVDGNDYAKSTDGNLYGFMKPQSRVRFSFTNANYPGLTLYSNEFTVPDGVTGTLKIVDEDGAELYSIANAFFSDATDGLPAEAKRDYTKYTYPAVPTTNGQTWTVKAEPSDDAPFAWAKTYGSATWYYMSVGAGPNKWATAGESNGGAGTAHGGHALKSSYSTSDNNYRWAFVGNQYDGFKIYNLGRGNEQTLQDYSGYMTPPSGGAYPTMRSGSSLTWIVRTNSSGSGFSLENKDGGTDNGVNAPCFLNNFGALGYMNYWITNDYDSQNDPGSLFTVEEAGGPLSTTVKWVIVDGNYNPIYNLITDVESGATISSYPTELSTMASERFVTLPALTPFTAGSGQTVKNVSYTWTGPFQISTTGNEHHYQLKIRNALYITSNTMAGGQLNCTTSSEVTNDQRWMFFGDPFNGFIIRNYAKSGQALAAANGYNTSGSSFPTFEAEGTRWIITSCTQAGYTNPFSIAPAGTTGVYWNQYGGINNNQGVKYWTANGSSDGGAAIQAIEIADAVDEVPIIWTIVDGEGNEMFSTTVNHNYGSTVSSYPAALTDFAERFVGYPALSSFTATEPKEVQVTYNWTGPFQLTTDTDNPHLYFFKSTRYSYYAYAPDSPTGQAKQASGTKNWVTPRGRWFFTGDPFNGIEIRPYAYPETGLVNSMLSTTPTKYIPKANPDITTNYWDNALPSAAISFVIPNSSNCLAEQLGTWSANDINSDKGLSFVVEEADDISMLVSPGYYQVRCMGSGLTSKYWKLDDQGGVKKLWNDGNPDDMNTVFRIEENINASNGLPESYYIAGFDGDEAWYLDNTRTSYSQQFTATQTPANYMPAQIIYNAKAGDVPYYAIKLSNQSDYSGYSYANTNSNGNTVVTWVYTSGTADGSAWALEPTARVTLNAVGDKSYATFYFDRDVQTDANTKAYYITTTSNNYAHLTEVDNEGQNIPARTAVVLINDEKASSAKFNVTSGLLSVVDAETNLLKGTLTSMSLDLSDATPYYSMGRLNGEIGFYKFTDGTITLGANKAYLEVPTSSGIKGFIFDLDDDPTGINDLKDLNDVIFNISGQRLSKPQRGVNIINGKKVLIK